MRTDAQRWIGRGAVVAAVLGVSMLGNLRLHASEVSRPSMAPTLVATAAIGDGDVRRFAGSDADGVGADQPSATDDDDGRLVPAIYAWDPDVRFVYYRHVSKWM